MTNLGKEARKMSGLTAGNLRELADQHVVVRLADFPVNDGALGQIVNYAHAKLITMYGDQLIMIYHSMPPNKNAPHATADGLVVEVIAPDNVETILSGALLNWKQHWDESWLQDEQIIYTVKNKIYKWETAPSRKQLDRVNFLAGLLYAHAPYALNETDGKNPFFLEIVHVRNRLNGLIDDLTREFHEELCSLNLAASGLHTEVERVVQKLLIGN